jgi:DNA-directed RNA polymerase subunit RPC12/RpoP
MEEEQPEDRQIQKGFMLGISCENCGARFLEQFADGIAVPSSEQKGGEYLQVFAYDYENEKTGKELGQIQCPHCSIKEYLKITFRVPLGFNQEWDNNSGKIVITEAGDEDNVFFPDDSAAIN